MAAFPQIFTNHKDHEAHNTEKNIYFLTFRALVSFMVRIRLFTTPSKLIFHIM